MLNYYLHDCVIACSLQACIYGVAVSLFFTAAANTLDYITLIQCMQSLNIYYVCSCIVLSGYCINPSFL